MLGLEFNEAVTGATCTVTTGALGTCPDCKVEYVIIFVCDSFIMAHQLGGCSGSKQCTERQQSFLCVTGGQKEMHLPHPAAVWVVVPHLHVMAKAVPDGPGAWKPPM